MRLIFKRALRVKKPIKLKFFNPKMYPAPRSKKEWKLIDNNPFGDTDGDKVPNWFDCKPLNRKKQGFEHQYSFSSVASKDIKTVKMPPELFLKTTYGESMRRARNKEQREESIGPYNRYKDDLKHGADGTERKERYFKYVEGELVRLPLMKKGTGMKRRIEGKDENHIPIPMLQFDEEGKQIGHEGRHTAIVAEKMKLKYIPVTIERPKQTKLSYKYEKLQPIKGKQYKDWEYDEKQGKMKASPVIEKNDLYEDDDLNNNQVSDKAEALKVLKDELKEDLKD